MTVVSVLAAVLIGGGIFFLFVGSLGIVRMPDFYTRLHAGGSSDTLGLILTLGGLALHEVATRGFTLTSLKIAGIAVFFFLANPTSVHALGRAALRAGLTPWEREEDGS